MGERIHIGKHLSLHPYKIGNGSKYVGGQVWWNSNRVALQLGFLVWEIQILWDF